MNNLYNPLVSIALTTSKSEQFLKEQLDSLINQTYKNIEIVISHDECGDNTQSILNEYVGKYQNISWSLNKKPKGYIGNNENAISLCRGEIIFLCDHDDSWYPEKVAEHVKAYGDPSVQWVYNKAVLTDGTNTKEIGFLEDIDPKYYRHKTLLENTWGTCIGGALSSLQIKCAEKSTTCRHTRSSSRFLDTISNIS